MESLFSWIKAKLRIRTYLLKFKKREIESDGSRGREISDLRLLESIYEYCDANGIKVVGHYILSSFEGQCELSVKCDKEKYYELLRELSINESYLIKTVH